MIGLKYNVKRNLQRKRTFMLKDLVAALCIAEVSKKILLKLASFANETLSRFQYISVQVILMVLMHCTKGCVRSSFERMVMSKKGRNNTIIVHFCSLFFQQ